MVSISTAAFPQCEFALALRLICALVIELYLVIKFSFVKILVACFFSPSTWHLALSV